MCKHRFSADKFLTPGPLVMALTGGPPKGPPPGAGGGWPPKDGDNIEMIAASFVPPKSGSKVRLFNLATDVPTASLSSAGKSLATGVKYTLGSVPWAAVPAGLATFTASASAGNLSCSGAHCYAGLATASFNPPAAPVLPNENTIVLLKITLFRGAFYILSAFSKESSEKRWHLYCNLQQDTFNPKTA